MSERYESATVRIWEGPPHAGAKFCGSAFMVSPTQALTAFHVVGLNPAKQFFIYGTWNGGFYARVSEITPHPEASVVDVALLRISDEAAAPETHILPAKFGPPLRPGESITMIGFSDEYAAVNVRRGYTQGLDGVANACTALPPPAKGMSGGPVISEGDTLRGLMWARNADKGHAYITPATAFERFLGQNGVACESWHPRDVGSASLGGDTESSTLPLRPGTTIARPPRDKPRLKQTPIEFPPAPPRTYAEDRNEGRFGGQNKRDGIELFCRQVSGHRDKSYFVFDAIIRPDEISKPIGPAKFFLHESFRRSAIVIHKPRMDGTLVLEEIKAWGTFVIGCQVRAADGHWIMLEYNTLNLPGLDKGFKAR